jgi:hypothetical protein
MQCNLRAAICSLPAGDENSMTEALHHPAALNPDALFPAGEWQSFRDSDKQAATAIVVLMVGIFVIGVILYTIVLVTL